MALGDLLRNPLFAATYAVAWAGWVVSLAGVAQMQKLLNSVPSAAVLVNSYGLAWWTVFFVLFILVWILFTVFQGMFGAFRSVTQHLVTLAAALTTINTSAFLLSKDSGVNDAATGAAGFIILDVILYLWIFLIAVMAPLEGGDAGGGVSMPKITMPFSQGSSAAAAPTVPAHGAAPSGGPPDNGRGSQYDDGTSDEPVMATAQFSYSANPNDPNEISFQKGDVLTIIEKKGKWWRARTADGAVGIVPSNYMEVKQSGI